MKKVFIKVLSGVAEGGELKEATFYEDNYFNVKFEKSGKKYSVSVSCEDAKENKANGN